MKLILALAMIGLAAQATAQEQQPEWVTREMAEMNVNDPRFQQYEPSDAPGLDPALFAGLLNKPEEPCFDFSAMPNGVMADGGYSFPTKACVANDYSVEPLVASAPIPVPQAQQTGSPLPQAAQATGAPQQAPMQDLNARQMQRFGELDAMQGKPLNMNYANALGYMQGYTYGQQKRMQAPGMGQAGGNFGGFGR